jgi:hypothetical protein
MYDKLDKPFTRNCLRNAVGKHLIRECRMYVEVTFLSLLVDLVPVDTHA